MMPEPYRSRHRPLLSLDASLFRRNPEFETDGSVTVARGTASATLKRTPALSRSFAKGMGSVYKDTTAPGMPQEVRARRYGRLLDDAGKAGIQQPGGLSAKDPSVSPRTTNTATEPSINEGGPLIQRHTVGGAKLTLSLDRHIQYRASPGAAFAWTFHHFLDSQKNPFRQPNPNAANHPSVLSPEHRSSPEHNPFSDHPEILAVPRLLLSFTLDVEPYISLQGNIPHENFEFVSLYIDFWTASHVSWDYDKVALVQPNHLNGPLPPELTTKRSLRASTELPIVRGMACSELNDTGFLQKFGPILYQDLHARHDDPIPVVLGSGEEKQAYKEFEAHLARIGKPTLIESDKITGRGCHDLSSSLNTPATTVFPSSTSASGAPSPSSPSFNTSGFGTSSIRVMVKRDTLQENAWSRRKFPFIILLEHPPGAAAIEARARLDMTTVRKSALPRTIIQAQSNAVHQRQGWLSQQSGSAGQVPISSVTPLSPANLEHKRQSSGKIALARSLSTSSARSSSSNSVDALEQLITIFPRKDPVSVISCGAESVKDTLFKSGMVSHRAWPPASTAVARQINHSRRRSDSDRESQLSRVPVGDHAGTSKAGASLPNYRHAHTQSAQITPGMYKRTGSFGSVTSNISEQSRGSSSEGSVYSQPSAPRPHFRQQHNNSVPMWSHNSSSAEIKSQSSQSNSIPRFFSAGPSTSSKVSKRTSTRESTTSLC